MPQRINGLLNITLLYITIYILIAFLIAIGIYIKLISLDILKKIISDCMLSASRDSDRMQKSRNNFLKTEKSHVKSTIFSYVITSNKYLIRYYMKLLQQICIHDQKLWPSKKKSNV